MGYFDELERQLDEQASLIPMAEKEARSALLRKLAEREEVFKSTSIAFQEYFEKVLKKRLQVALVVQHGQNLDQRTNRIVRDRLALVMNVVHTDSQPYRISSPMEARYLSQGDIRLSDGTQPQFHPNIALQFEQILSEDCDMKTGTWDKMDYKGSISVWGKPEGYQRDIPIPEGMQMSVSDHGWNMTGTTIWFSTAENPYRTANAVDNLRKALTIVTPNVFQHKDIIRGTSTLR